ncbi:MAG: hypothetical protein H6R07_813 [Proteobacteria bacterium]|nr:hypothetical protein [Pseudomonadota bacterium]
MYLIAHRGLSHIAPENTLAAFACALAAGFHGIQTDVRLSADGELVLFHNRTTPDGLSVSALTRSELSLEAGYLVPTLSESLEAFPDALWNIEIKTPAAAPATFALLDMFAGQRNILLTSVRHEIILEAAELLDVECGLLIAHRPPALNTVLYPAMPYPRLRTLVWDYEALDPGLQQQANALGFHNWVYGAQTDYEHAFCSEFGIHGIITDYPEFVGLSYSSGLQ